MFVAEPHPASIPVVRPGAQASLLSRIVVLAYGVVAYLGFLAAFSYAIGFEANLLVPKGIDDGAVGPLGEALLVNSLLLGLFAVQHSIMARAWFKRRWPRIIPAAAERSTFVVATCIALGLIYWLWRPIPGYLWNFEGTSIGGLLSAVSYAGWALVVIATFLIDHFGLFGLRQVINYARGRTHREPAFTVRSFYRYIRHPLYLGFVMAFWCTPAMSWGHFFFSAMTTGFILVAVRFEESDLIRAHGRAYRDYRAQVPMILPLRGRVVR